MQPRFFPGAPIPIAGTNDAPATCTDAEPFALQVTDRSMEPEFPQGCVVVVDPSVAPHHGSYVVAGVGDSVVLRRLVRERAHWWLETLAADTTREPARLDTIRGTVTQRAARRRRDRKRYT